MVVQGWKFAYNYHIILEYLVCLSYISGHRYLVNKNRNISLSEENDGRYRSIFDAANDGLIIADLKTGFVVEANPAASAMHGYTAKEFTNIQLTALIHLKSLPGFNHHFKNLQLDGTLNSTVLEVCRDGSTFYAEWRGTAFNYKGRPCLLGLVRDAHKQIQAEKSLHQRVETRTHEQATLLDDLAYPGIHPGTPAGFDP